MRIIIYFLLMALGQSLLFGQEPTANLKIKHQKPEKKEKKSLDEKMTHAEEMMKYEYQLLQNPVTGLIPREEQLLERQQANAAKPVELFGRSTNVYTSRGPTNLGGRVRALAIDKRDNNIMLAGGVSGGMFRSTDAGASWVKVSPNDDIHNVSCIVQDPRAGFEDTWYYGTGEFLGNSTSQPGAFYLGRGIWKSMDNGLTWSQIASTDSDNETFDSFVDVVADLAVDPANGDLYVAAVARIYKVDTAGTLTLDLTSSGPNNTGNMTDIEVSANGTLYAAIPLGADAGVYRKTPGGSWTRIAQNGNPSGWASTGRITLHAAPNNADILYALYVNGASNGGNSGIDEPEEADLWRFNENTDTWTDFSAKLPDEPGYNRSGHDPFSVQGGYDLIVSSKPDNENYVFIGGTNAYKISNINTDTTFTRIGGYGTDTYALYDVGGVDHHPDIHAFVFDNNNSSILYSGTDGGLHRTDNVDAANVEWVNLNNNFQTYQYYHVALDSESGSDFVAGGSQDNGTTIGGVDVGFPDDTTMNVFAGGDGVSVGLARTAADAVIIYFGFQNGAIRRFINPNSSVSIRPTGSLSQFVTYFHLDRDNTNNLYYASVEQTGGANVGEVFATNSAETVGGFSWRRLGLVNNTQTTEFIYSYETTRGAYNPSTSYLMIGTDRGIYRLDDPANQTNLNSMVNITPADYQSGSAIVDIAVHPTNPDIAMAVASNYGVNSIFLTNNASSANPTWTLVERNLTAPSIRSCAITETSGVAGYYVGTARGLFSNPDPLTTDWSIEGQNVLGQAVVRSLDYRPSDNILLIGTHGNGMYQTTPQDLLGVNDAAVERSDRLFIKQNPVQSLLKIGYTGSGSKMFRYYIANAAGQTVKKGVFETSNGDINVQNLSKGIYYVSVNVDGTTEVIKFIKQ